jgi:hypothetical protein
VLVIEELISFVDDEVRVRSVLVTVSDSLAMLDGDLEAVWVYDGLWVWVGEVDEEVVDDSVNVNIVDEVALCVATAVLVRP